MAAPADALQDLRHGSSVYVEFMHKIGKPKFISDFWKLSFEERAGWQQIADDSELFDHYDCYFPMFREC